MNLNYVPKNDPEIDSSSTFQLLGLQVSAPTPVPIYVLSRVSSVATKTPWPKSHLERKVFIWLTLPDQSITGGSQDTNSSKTRTLEAGADAGHGEVLLTALLRLICYRTQDHQLRDDTTHNELGPPLLITN